jgi:hypothetical protein
MTEPRLSRSSPLFASRGEDRSNSASPDEVKPWNVIGAMATTAIIDLFRAPSNAPQVRRTRRKRIEETLASDIRNGVVLGQLILHEGDKETLLGEAKHGKFIANQKPPSLFDKRSESAVAGQSGAARDSRLDGGAKRRMRASATKRG